MFNIYSNNFISGENNDNEVVVDIDYNNFSLVTIEVV